ncbi:hypothetical protein Dda_4936 [Drechslerella dactyloides]|uniref:Uncharacterized protein n=1 Tax=Drechslerella dactyloides TaxID=74499 RepID=A0AAD6NJP9_DREDA|nr:hypothetical protein Dda_4936 [Drechslerella dactyloides]
MKNEMFLKEENMISNKDEMFPKRMGISRNGHDVESGRCLGNNTRTTTTAAGRDYDALTEFGMQL